MGLLWMEERDGGRRWLEKLRELMNWDWSVYNDVVGCCACYMRERWRYAEVICV